VITHRRPFAPRLLAALPLVAVLTPALALAAPLTIEDAIRAAWADAPALRASAALARAADAEADRARDARLPTLSLAARALRTDEPMLAFGLRLDQGRITAADFDPARLNDPAAIGGVGGGVTVSLPLFTGGRLRAGQRAAGEAARAAGADDARRRMEVAAAVVEAYFGAQAAEEGIRHADELLAHAAETERFVRERNAQGLALDADLARASAFRAQAQAERAVAGQRRASARSALALLAGAGAADADLTTPLAAPGTRPDAGGPPEDRPDLRAAALRRDAAREGVTAARAALLPGVFAQASAETMRTPDLDQGTSWTTVGLLLRWELGFADAAGVRAASAQAAAAEHALAWRRREAAREVEDGDRAVETADARLAAAAEAVSASESARTLRIARHRQGLLPLTDVLDAEAALAGARALLVASRFDARVSRARLALALHQPIEGLMP
jgi:outer membrane protein TolC